MSFHEKLSFDGRRLAWECETVRGKVGQVTIEGAEFDPAAGTLFLVSTKGGQIQTRQLKRDWSGLRPDEASFAKVAKEDPHIVRFVAEALVPD